ncbi:MAG: acyl carrier protein [Leptospirales bacterium]|jgi:acyl carrier protein
MDRKIIEGAVADVLRNHCNVSKEIGAKSRLAEDLGLDSVGLLTMAVEVENHFQTVLGEEPERPPRTVSDVVDLIEQRLAERKI